jgi:acetyl esterase/lipase
MCQPFPFFARLKRKVGAFCIGSFVFFQVLNAETGIEIKKDLVYATKDNLELKLDAYLPAGSKLRPSVLVIHGGGWRFGSKRQLTKYASGLAGRGFNAFAINYRLAPQHKHPAQIEDCRDAVRWIKKNSGRYGGDPDRIGALGYSAGAHLACMLAVTGQEKAGNEIGTKILVAVGGGTPCEFMSLPAKNKTLAYWLGGSREERPKAYRDASPLEHLDKGDSPIFFFHGDADFLVGMSGAKKMSGEMKKLGIDTHFHVIKGAGHFRAVFNSNAIGESFDFLEKHLKETIRKKEE